MLKFTELPYERPEMDGVTGQMKELIGELKNAPDYEVARVALLKEDRLVRHVMTVRTIATIRHSVDTRDPFYDEECKYWNRTMPQLQEYLQAWAMALLESPFRADFEKEYGRVVFLNAELEKKSFSPEIIPEMQRENDLVQEYEKLLASAQIPFEGGVYTISQMTPTRMTRADSLPGRRKGSGIRIIRRNWTGSMMSWSICAIPWAGSSDMTGTGSLATAAWRETAIRLRISIGSGKRSGSMWCR